MTHTHSAASGKEAQSAPSAAPRRSGAAPFSLLGLSAFERLAGVSVVIALLWAGVLWALH
jgi:hypothetical protein